MGVGAPCAFEATVDSQIVISFLLMRAGGEVVAVGGVLADGFDELPSILLREKPKCMEPHNKIHFRHRAQHEARFRDSVQQVRGVLDIESIPIGELRR
jgi:hypothetical protein